jgi:hypothetical protein
MSQRDSMRLLSGALVVLILSFVIIGFSDSSHRAPAQASAASSYTIALPLILGGSIGASIAGCPQFPADNPWNRDVSGDPVDPNSNNYINNINLNGSGTMVHPDFGSSLTYGIPYTIVPSSQISIPVNFVDWPDQSDSGPYPIPSGAPIESGSDHHVLTAQFGVCKLFEMYNSSRLNDNWQASSGAIFDLRSNTLRSDCWTSADAAGLPILPGLARYDEVQAGIIRHALRFTVYRSQQAFIHPATHYASSLTDPNYPPMGLRMRLKANYDISGFPHDSKVILGALKKYGMMLADNGSNWYVSGATDGRWNDLDLDHLKLVPGSAFEVVQSGTIYTSSHCP